MNAKTPPSRTAVHRTIRALFLLALAASVAVAASGEDAAPAPPASAAERTLEAAYHFATAKLLADEGKFREAAEAYERALELDDSDPYSRLEAAKFHAYLAQISRAGRKRLEHLQQAADHAAEARAMAPENLDVLRDYAQIHLRLGEQQQSSIGLAQEAYERLRLETEGDLYVLTSLGQIYMMRGQADRAIEVLREAASYRPRHRMLQSMLLDALLEVDRLDEAEEVLARLVAISPESLEHRLRLAKLRSDRGDHRAAVAVLREAPPTLAENPQLRQFLAQELHLSGAHREALELVDAMRAERPGDADLRRLRVAILAAMVDYSSAIDELRALLAAQPPAERATHDVLLLARLLERSGRPEEAAEVLRARLAEGERGETLQVVLTLASALERQEESDQAVALLRRELDAASPEHLPLLSRALAELLARADRLDQALEVLDRAIDALPGDEHAAARTGLGWRRLVLLAGAEQWQRLRREAPAVLRDASAEMKLAGRLLQADALAGLGRLDEALAIVDAEEGASEAARRQLLAKRTELLLAHDRAPEARALIEDLAASGEADDLFFAAQLYQRGERYADAIDFAGRLLEREPESRPALFLLGAAQERTGARDAAIATFKRLLALEPDHAPALNYLGYMWAEHGENLPEAVELISRAVALDPDNGAYVDSLGWAYFQLGRYDEARSHLEWAARLVPDDATIFEHLGDLYVALKDMARARASYRQALDLGGDDLDALRHKLEVLEEKNL